MLPKKNRFTRAAFDAFVAQQNLKTVYNQLGTLKYAPVGNRFAVVTSSKHEKRAVVRNRLRRRVYNLFYAASVPCSGILYASKQSYSLDMKETKRLFENLLNRAAKSAS